MNAEEQLAAVEGVIAGLVEENHRLQVERDELMLQAIALKASIDVLLKKTAKPATDTTNTPCPLLNPSINA